HVWHAESGYPRISDTPVTAVGDHLARAGRTASHSSLLQVTQQERQRLGQFLRALGVADNGQPGAAAGRIVDCAFDALRWTFILQVGVHAEHRQAAVEHRDFLPGPPPFLTDAQFARRTQAEAIANILRIGPTDLISGAQ